MFTRTLALALLAAGLLSSGQPAGAASGHDGKIVFAQANLEDNDSNIWVMNPDGSGETQLTSTGHDLEPAWSADAAKIVFSRNSHVWVMNANGSAPTRLTTNAATDHDARPGRRTRRRSPSRALATAPTRST